MTLRIQTAWLLCLLLLALPAREVAGAQSHDEEEPSHGEAHEHRHEATFVLGGTYESTEEASFFTLGDDYEFRVHPRLGIGGTVEYLTGLDAVVLVIPVTVHLYRGLAVYGGPGWELEPRRSGEEESHGENHTAGEGGGNETFFLARIGIQYGFEFGSRYSILPTVAFDFIDKEEEVGKAVVYAVKFAIAF
jgi:hypothetical protein